jgi:hypothetical protein
MLGEPEKSVGWGCQWEFELEDHAVESSDFLDPDF